MSIRQKKKRGALWAYLLSVAFIAVLVVFVLTSLSDMARRTAEENLRSTEDGIRRAAVHCYAIEGQYPESVAYLEDNYGLTIDYDRYVVHYDCFADNVMPEITVFTLDQAEEGDV